LKDTLCLDVASGPWAAWLKQRPSALLKRIIPGILLVAQLDSDASAQTFAIAEFALGDDGGTSRAGAFVFTGGAVTTDMETLSGGAFDLMGGAHFDAVVTSTPELPLLGVSYEAVAGHLILSWPGSARGYFLEACSDLGASAVWTQVSVTPQQAGSFMQVTVPFQLGRQFYRLRKPSGPPSDP
jgi:hypothetical protein